jgi:hypothetical protein
MRFFIHELNCRANKILWLGIFNCKISICFQSVLLLTYKTDDDTNQRPKKNYFSSAFDNGNS